MSALEMASSVHVKVRGIAAGGSGVADLPDGRVVFVPRTAPGDRVSIKIDRAKPRWAMGSVRKILEPGDGRVKPLCALYHDCGGCQLQHIPYKSQLEWKGRIVADALKRIGGLSDIEPPTVVASPEVTEYRSRMTFTLRRLRGGHIAAGFYGLHRPAHVVDVSDECVLPVGPLIEVWRSLRRGWGRAARHLPSAGRLQLTLQLDDRGITLIVDGGRAPWKAERLCEAVPELSAIWHVPGDGASEPRLLIGSESGKAVPRFEQANSGAALLLLDYLVGIAGSGTRAIDAYCGSGRYGHALAAGGWEVIGVESDVLACRAARLSAPVGFTIIEGQVEDRLTDLLPAELLIVNPPRVGLSSEVVEAVSKSPARRLIYVSCDPATLGRDINRLRGTYTPEGVRCFDFFPQTAHVETVIELRAGGAL